MLNHFSFLFFSPYNFFFLIHFTIFFFFFILNFCICPSCFVLHSHYEIMMPSSCFAKNKNYMFPGWTKKKKNLKCRKKIIAWKHTHTKHMYDHSCFIFLSLSFESLYIYIYTYICSRT